MDDLTAHVSALTLARDSDYAELKAYITELQSSTGSALSTLADKFAQMEHNTGAVIAEVLRENRELRAENVRLSAEIRSSEVTTQLDGTSASLPSITPTVEPSPQQWMTVAAINKKLLHLPGNGHGNLATTYDPWIN